MNGKDLRMNEKILVAMSGGVDSAAAAILLKNQGFDVTGVTMKLYSPNELITDTDAGLITQDIIDAKSLANKLMIPHEVIPFGESFRCSVIDKFISDYKAGATPNPCIECNKKIKFGKLFSYSKEHGFEKLATGHYASVECDTNGRYVIKKAKDASKDQSYVLWSLTQDVLSSVILPLGKYSKSEIREIVSDVCPQNANKSDSQDICFIPDGDYVSFIESNTNDTFPAGKFIDACGNVLGEHQGIIRYTVGQRKGLGIALGRPMFVKEKNVENNTVTLCDNIELFSKTLTAKNINLIACDDLYNKARLTAKIRYKHGEAAATVTQISDDKMIVEFDEPQRAIAKGQSVVLYDGETLVGGGIIE